MAYGDTHLDRTILQVRAAGMRGAAARERDEEQLARLRQHEDSLRIRRELIKRFTARDYTYEQVKEIVETAIQRYLQEDLQR